MVKLKVFEESDGRRHKWCRWLGGAMTKAKASVEQQKTREQGENWFWL